MTVDEMKAAIIDELRIELSGDPAFSEDLLRVKVDSAVREVKRVRKYPTYYTPEIIERDLCDFFSNIKAIALYDYNQIGIEGQSASSENGENRTYVDRNTLFRGVIPFAR
jgi:hypothetical protein